VAGFAQVAKPFSCETAFPSGAIHTLLVPLAAAGGRSVPKDPDMNALRGSCHCGNVEFTLFTEKSAADLVPRRCSCSMCRRHGASYVSDPGARLALRYRDPSSLSVYRFGHGTAQWIICSRCGVLTAVVCEIDDRLRAVVRVQSMVEHTFAATETPTDFEDESVAGRLDRRAKTWIGAVEVSPPLPRLPTEAVALGTVAAGVVGD
jgi:hypothetical protein